MCIFGGFVLVVASIKFSPSTNHQEFSVFNSPSHSSQASESHNPSDHDCLVARAKAEASRMRAEAIRDFGTHAFANFWRDANSVWQYMAASAGSASRSARRLQARLDHRQAPTHSA
jgi:hypothetical protein